MPCIPRLRAHSCIRIRGNSWAGLISPEASGEHLLRVVAHEVSHLAGVFSRETGTDEACAKDDSEDTCATTQTDKIWAEVRAYLEAQAAPKSSASQKPKEK